MNDKRTSTKKVIVASVIIITTLTLIILKLSTDKISKISFKNESAEIQEEIEYIDPDLQKAVEAGKLLSTNNCSGYGTVTLGTSPMKEADFAFIEPYGLMIDAHVTPIDHQYFAPAQFNSPRDKYDVYAMADGTITEIQHRVSNENNEQHSTDEYRIVFMHTCTFFTYYDLVTSLAPDIQKVFEQSEKNNYAGNLNIKVIEGQLVGRIGGQTLDFAVWNTEKPLTGFVKPNSYSVEPWKIYTTDPYEYYSIELKKLLTNKNLRTAVPIAGKIDYDIEGKLIGNWFEEDTNGYQGLPPKYWSTHLSIVPNHLDPTGIMISIGNFDGKAQQFSAQEDAINPAEVDINSEIIRYELMDFQYLKKDGSLWDRMSLSRGLTVHPTQQRHGSILFQILSDNKLKVETFPRVPITQELTFTENAKIYER